MPDTVFQSDLTIPAGNGSSRVWFVPVNLGWSDVVEAMLIFPPGCAGLVGVQLQYAVNPVYPNAAGGYYIMDDYVLTIPISNQQQGGQWRVAGYNQDTYPHTVRCYWSYNYLTLSPNSGGSSLVSL
jgi:hypothetical protein